MKSFSPTFGDVVDGDGRLADAPFNRSTGARTLALTAVDASIALVAGYYTVAADGASDTAVLGLNGSTAGLPPASGAAEELGCVTVPVGAVASLFIDRDLTLHARVLSGTATLRLQRKSV